jgi:hypothetical protein
MTKDELKQLVVAIEKLEYAFNLICEFPDTVEKDTKQIVECKQNGLQFINELFAKYEIGKLDIDFDKLLHQSNLVKKEIYGKKYE